MATTYTTLLTEVANYLHRDDLTATIPTFVKFAEAKFNRKLRTRDMEASTDLTVSSQTVALPSDFREVRRIYLSGQDIVNYKPPYDFWDIYAGDTSSDTPRDATIEASNMIFGPAPDQTYTGKLLYYQDIPNLQTNSTNWLLDKHPDLYLYGCLLEAEPFIKNDQRLATWAQLYATAMDQIQEEDMTSRIIHSPSIRVAIGSTP